MVVVVMMMLMMMIYRNLYEIIRFFICGLYWAILGSSWGYAGVLCKHWFWCTQPVFIYEDISVFFDFFPVATSGFCVGIRPREQNWWAELYEFILLLNLLFGSSCSWATALCLWSHLILATWLDAMCCVRASRHVGCWGGASPGGFRKSIRILKHFVHDAQSLKRWDGSLQPSSMFYLKATASAADPYWKGGEHRWAPKCPKMVSTEPKRTCWPQACFQSVYSLQWACV